jgi:hypothetical protein
MIHPSEGADVRRAVSGVGPGREWPGSRARTSMRPVLRRTSIFLLIALALAAPAGAGTIVVKLGLTPGKLTVAAAPTSMKPGATVAIPVKVADGRGNGSGWTLRFAGGKGLTVVGITARCAANSTCKLPTAAAGPNGAVVLQAARATGMGIVDLVVTVRSSSATSVAFSIV